MTQQQYTQQQIDNANRVGQRARKSLISFSKFIKPDYQVEPFHELIAEKLEAVADGKIKRLAISMPPRS